MPAPIYTCCDVSDDIHRDIYISRKTLRSLRPEIGEFAGRAGEDRAVEDRAGEDMAGQGRAGGHIKSGQSKSRAGRGQKAGHDGHCAI